jgi:hypothetical protein
MDDSTWEWCDERVEEKTRILRAQVEDLRNALNDCVIAFEGIIADAAREESAKPLYRIVVARLYATKARATLANTK